MDKILVIEDDEIIKNELCILLQSNGYQTVESLPCDLALLDINLPGDSGYEICRKLRLKSDVPVIFLTARDGAEDELIGFGVGADDFIRKPYNSSVLLARISRLLKRKNNTLKQVRGLTLNLEDMSVTFGENHAELTRNETRILACLILYERCAAWGTAYENPGLSVF